MDKHALEQDQKLVAALKHSQNARAAIKSAVQRLGEDKEDHGVIVGALQKASELTETAEILAHAKLGDRAIARMVNAT